MITRRFYAIYVTKASQKDLNFRKGWLVFNRSNAHYMSEHTLKPSIYPTRDSAEAAATDIPKDAEFVVYELVPTRAEP